MRKKEIEKISWLAKKTRKKNCVSAACKLITQNNEKILVVDYSTSKPLCRICMNEKNFISYFPDEISERDLKIKKGWNTRKIDPVVGEFSKYNGCMYYITKTEPLSEDSLSSALTFFQTKIVDLNDLNRKISIFESDCISAKSEKTWKKRMEKERLFIKEWTGDIKPEPLSFKKWAIKKVRKAFLRVEPFYKNSEANAHCTECGETFLVQKDNLPQRCPCCNNKVTIIKSNKPLNDFYKYGEEKEVILLQNVKGNLVQRHFKAWRNPVNDFMKYGIYELGLYVEKDGIVNRFYSKYDCWNGVHFYDNKNVSGMNKIYLGSGPIYNTSILKKWDKFKYSAIELVGETDPIKYLARYIQMPQLEMLAKVGLTNLAKTIEPENMAFEYKKPWEMLMVDKEEFNRLRGLNASIPELEWMQFEHSSGKRLADEDISFFGREHHYRPSNFEFILDKMSLKQIRNYLETQVEVTKEEFPTLVWKWRDYIDMCKVEKKDVSLEINYKPKHIVTAHDDLANKEVIADRTKEIDEMFAGIENVFPEISEKYSYEDDNYSVVIPASVSDIVREGKILGHCLDRSNIYFDRILRKESFIFFLRRKADVTAPYYTLEVEPDGTVRQARTTGDKQTEDYKNSCIPFIKKWQRAIKSRMSEEDDILQKNSSILREQEFNELEAKGNRIWHGVYQGQLLVDVLRDSLILAED